MEKYHFKDQSINERIILKWIQKKKLGRESLYCMYVKVEISDGRL